MALSFVLLRYFSMLHWIGCFLAQHTLQDLHQILIKAVSEHSKTRVCGAAICIVFHTVNCIVVSFSTPSLYTLHYNLHFLSS